MAMHASAPMDTATRQAPAQHHTGLRALWRDFGSPASSSRCGIWSDCRAERVPCKLHTLDASVAHEHPNNGALISRSHLGIHMAGSHAGADSQLQSASTRDASACRGALPARGAACQRGVPPLCTRRRTSRRCTAAGPAGRPGSARTRSPRARSCRTRLRVRTASAAQRRRGALGLDRVSPSRHAAGSGVEHRQRAPRAHTQQAGLAPGRL